MALALFHAPRVEAGEVARRLAEEHHLGALGRVLRASPGAAPAPLVAGAGAGAVRASLGIGCGIDDIEQLPEALEALLASRPRLIRRSSPVARLASPVAGAHHR